MPNNVLFLSIRPRYANKILEGIKTVELRRVHPKRIGKGDIVLIYAPSPVKSLVGAFEVDRVVEKPVEELWHIANGKNGITRNEFDAYFKGVTIGVGIFFNKVWRLPKPIQLQELREIIRDFHPPQGFRYATSGDLELPRISEILKGLVNP
ncbi:MAG: ASCH domain-containing protein [Chloroflexi bacterium]|jgi:predicted transcriptional regulator|nr:ASCH domain-containing protein [Chloroflexota bacterium]